MGAIATITIAAPNQEFGDVVLKPQQVGSDGVVTWVDSSPIYDSKKKMTLSVTFPKNGSQVVRVKQRFMVPVMDANDYTKKIAEAYANVEFVLPKNISDGDRWLLTESLGALFAHNRAAYSPARSAVDNLEAPY